MFRRTVSCAFALAAAGLIAAAVSPAHAESRAANAISDAAAGIINADGSLNNGLNIVRSWRADVGRYCVQLAPAVSAAGGLIQLTPRDPRRLPHIAYRDTSPICGTQNTITIDVYNSSTGRPADGGFDLLVL
ncbi:hypothetical protein FAF44_49270 [Nonomuraea sp. MG754425]|uniref:hypothetical protein n=1 Tax=Nonomuraea sp. MG754425 TaxID=2570319 RepID=UPI001F210A0F|nr:hypothetical protein [Nonomuraea sp. MG754425]MCF6476281.1 hypothetical protein [Nonomuraea sp. MG754425]